MSTRRPRRVRTPSAMRARANVVADPTVTTLQRWALQRATAVGEFLNAIGEPVFEEAPIIRWGLRFEELLPLLLQLGGRHCLQGRDPGQYTVVHHHAFLPFGCWA